MPAGSMDAGTRAFFDLTGAPPVPPRYAFGFIACRWGWENRDYIDKMLTNFRSGFFPLDAWISDFEWFTDYPDYKLHNSGAANYHDFSYNNITFPEPQAQLKEYHENLNLRFGGIRKPRFGNSDLLVMAREKNWTIGNGRNLNYSIPGVREYYRQQQLHYLQDGVDFWWNDEGETDYFTNHWWNVAEVETLKDYNPKGRFFSINRAYSPGMSRLGAALWTGDIHAAWVDLQRTPGYMLNWGLMGAPYVTCDIGGFSGQTNPLLLTRWYQAGVFLPIMRVHSTNSAQPHFPFLWGDEAANAMRKALDLRYRLVPMLYSLAHAAYDQGRLLMRPLVADFDSDATTHDFTSQWMMGDSVMAAPVLNEDNSTTVHFPADSGLWYEFNSPDTHQGGAELNITNASLVQMPVYVRAGGILPLAQAGLQFTDQLPGGPLDLHIYSGRDGSFTLVEDDGQTTNYESGDRRTTVFTWDNAANTLTWKVTGAFEDSHTFMKMRAVRFGGGKHLLSDVVAIGTSGSLAFSSYPELV